MEFTSRAEFLDRSRAVAEEVRSCGVSLTKNKSRQEVQIERSGTVVNFPILSDPRMWASTTAEEAFYAALIDASSYSSLDAAKLDFEQLDIMQKSEIPQIAKRRTEAAGRLSSLVAVLGGKEAYLRVLAAGKIVPGE